MEWVKFFDVMSKYANKIFLNRKLLFFFLFLILSLFFIDEIFEILLEIGSYVTFKAPTFYLSYGLLIFLLTVFYFKTLKDEYIVNFTISGFIFLISIIYLFLRFDLEKVKFFLPYGCWIKYSDIIILVGLLQLLVVYRLKRASKPIIKNENSFLEDNIYKEGSISNEVVLESLIQRITNFWPDSSFAVGIVARWGYGKSTFLERFKNRYANQNDKAVIFWYRVWQNQGENAIIENFFEELKENLKPYTSDLSNPIDDYVKSILSLHPNDLSEKISNLFNTDRVSLEVSHNKINSAIKKLNRQIIVLLDDLDRLEEEEIKTTLRLIRVFSNFSNLIFLVGYDRTYVNSVFNNSKYTQKVFNVEIELLQMKGSTIFNEVLKICENRFSVKNKTESENDVFLTFRELFQTVLVTDSSDKKNGQTKHCQNVNLDYDLFLGSFRDIKKFINEFDFFSNLIEDKDNVIMREYIVLRLAMYRFKDLHYEVFHNLPNILSRGRLIEGDSTITISGENALQNHNIYVFDESAKERLVEINEVKQLSGRDKDVLITTLCYLFSKKKRSYYEVNQNAISKKIYLDLYLRNDIAVGLITISDLKSAADNAGIYKLINQYKTKYNETWVDVKPEIKNYVFYMEIDSIEKSKDFLKSINVLANANLYLDEDNTVQKLNVIRNKFFNSKAEFIGFFKSFILKNKEINFIDELMRDVLLNSARKRTGLYNESEVREFKNLPIDTYEIIEILNKKLEKNLNQTTSNIFDYYHLLTFEIVGNKKVLRPYSSNQIIRNYLDKDFAYLLKKGEFDINITEEDDLFDIRRYNCNRWFGQIFAGESKYEKVLHDSRSERFYNELVSDGFNNYFKFLAEKMKNENDELSKDLISKLSLILKLMNELNSNNFTDLLESTYKAIVGKHGQENPN